MTQTTKQEDIICSDCGKHSDSNRNLCFVQFKNCITVRSARKNCPENVLRWIKTGKCAMIALKVMEICNMKIGEKENKKAICPARQREIDN